MMNWGRAALMFAGGLLALGVSSSLVPRKSAYFFKPEKPLKDYLPDSGGGWVAGDRPLGATEFEAEKAREILRLDEFAFRTYRKGEVEFSIYCAYWRPGAQATDEAAAHNPDLCWTNAGWKSDDRTRTAVLQTPRGPTWPGQDRIFVHDRARQFVIFWHLQGGEPSGFGMGAQLAWDKRAPYIWNRLVRSSFGVREFEQYFIRLSANVPYDRLRTEPMFVRALGAISQFGLVAGR